MRVLPDGMIEGKDMVSTATGNRLPPRLTRKSEFRRVTRSGERYRLSFLQMYVHPAIPWGAQGKNVTGGRVGFVVPDRDVKGAVRRNRVRRLMREAVRHWWKHVRGGCDIVLRANGEPAHDSAFFVERIFLTLAIRAGVLTEEGRALGRERVAQLERDGAGVEK